MAPGSGPGSPLEDLSAVAAASQQPRIQDDNKPGDPGSESALDESEYDLTSTHFNPLKALYSSRTVLPRRVKPRDFLGMCRTLLPASSPFAVVMQTPGNDTQGRSQKAIDAHERGKARAKFEASLGPSKEKLSDELCADVPDVGPLAVLKRAFVNKERVRVVTRHNNGGLRGAIEGNVVIFDKRWNMVLRNAREKYTVVVRQHAEHTDERNKKVLEYRTRNLRQVLLKGDCVVLVGLAKNYKPAYTSAADKTTRRRLPWEDRR